MNIDSYDIVIVGASFGGVAAALAAAESTLKRVALIERSNWIGGQATAQGLTRWDESVDYVAWPITYGSSRSYRALKTAIGSWYRRYTTLARDADPIYFNPGNIERGQPFAADPHVVQAVMLDLLEAHHKARLDVLLNTKVVGANVGNGVLEGLTVESVGRKREITAAIFLDATDLGELLPLCNIGWSIGAESKADTGEPGAGNVAVPSYVQPITVPIALERRPDNERHLIERPAIYTDQLTRDQDFAIVSNRNGDIGGLFTCPPPPPGTSTEPMWDYRRYIDQRNFNDAGYECDRSTINVGSNDYQYASIPTKDPETDQHTVDMARAVSIAYVFWLQNQAPHDEDASILGYPNLMIRKDAFGTTDGTAPQPYIRESRRISKPLVRVVESDIAQTNALARAPKNYSDSCGIGYYGMDVHKIYLQPPLGPGTPWYGAAASPFQIPLGALIASDIRNVLASCKNIGTTHITSGAYRVHPSEWAVGEAAGTLAAYCVNQGLTPAQVRGDSTHLAALQLMLLQRGVPIFWWEDICEKTFVQNPQLFIAAHIIGVRGMMSESGSLKFRPNDDILPAEQDSIDRQISESLPWPKSPMKRADAAIWLCSQLGIPATEFVRYWERGL